MKFSLHSCLPAVLIAVSCGAAAQSRKSPVPAHGITIHVDDVTPAAKPYNQFAALPVLQQSMEKHVMVASDMPKELVPPSGNSFLETVHLAYAQHHDLVLSPDDIWIQIALGVSIHINEHFKELQPKVLNSPERQEIVVRIDDLTTMKSEHWKQLVDTFTVLARQKIQPDFYQTMLPEFSTSTAQTKTVLNAILLSSVKEGFLFRGASGCGIPNIILLGEKRDWEQLLAHVKELERYDLKFWTDELQPILQEFINAFDGQIDRPFWQCIYKYREAYGMSDMNGWISKFFPYFKHEEWVTDPEELAAFNAEHPDAEYEMLAKPGYQLNPYLAGDDYLFHSIDPGDLPTSVCTIPLIWNNYKSNNPDEQEQHLMLYAGFIGTVQEGPKYALKNNPVWLITRQEDTYESDDYLSAGSQTDYTSNLWADQTVSGMEVNAIYDPAHAKSPEAGLALLKQEIERHMKQLFPKESLSGVQLTFTVSHFGSCTQAKISDGNLTDKAQAELLLKLRKLNAVFQPATITNPTDERLRFIETEKPLVFKVNALIWLVF